MFKQKQKTKLDISGNHKARTKLYKACEKLKYTLSAIATSYITCECLYEDKDLHHEIKRSDIENHCSEKLKNMKKIIGSAVEQSGLKVDQLDGIEVVGGGMRIPAVKQAVKEFIRADQELGYKLDTAHCVGLGA